MPTLPRTFRELITEKGDYVVGDKGYSYLRARKWILLTPLRTGEEDDGINNTLSALNANFTRQITAIRNIVEHYISLIKNQFRKLKKPLRIYLIPKMYKVIPILCCIRNVFFKPLRKDTKTTKYYGMEFTRRRVMEINCNDLLFLRSLGSKNWRQVKINKDNTRGIKVLNHWLTENDWMPRFQQKTLNKLLLGIF